MNAPLNAAEQSALRIVEATRVVNGSKLIDLDQRTEAWHDWRNGKDLPDGKPRITATAAGVIFGNNPWRSVHDLWRELMGLAEPEPVNFAMERGVRLEPLVRQLYNEYTGNEVVPMCAEHPSLSWIGASLDGIDPLAAKVIAEFKCVGNRTHSYAESGLVPGYYEPQLQWQFAAVPSAMENHYFSANADRIDVLLKNGATVETHLDELLDCCKLVIVRPDPAFQAELIRRAAEFRQSLIDGVPPAGNAWVEAARIYVAAKQSADEAASILKEAERQLLDAVPEDQRKDGGSQEGGGVRVSYYAASAEVDYPRLVSELGIPEATVQKYRTEGAIDMTKLVADLALTEAALAKYRAPATVDYKALVEGQKLPKEIVKRFWTKTPELRRRITMTGEAPLPAPEVKIALPASDAPQKVLVGLDQF
jgi:putative phage-type endonuclease